MLDAAPEPPADPLQWSRPQLRTETIKAIIHALHKAEASMEPSSAEDGNESTATLGQGGTPAASMEPSSAEDGNVVAWQLEDSAYTGLQWSRPQLRTETRGRLLSANIKTQLQWSRPQLRTETYNLPAGSQVIVVASMEPSSAEDGNTTIPFRWTTGSVASMEPSSAEDGNLFHETGFAG